MPIPDLPGVLIERDSQEEFWLKNHVARLCNMEGHLRYVMTRLTSFCAELVERFPGSQPVSFSVQDLDKLENQECVYLRTMHLSSSYSLSFWVCEKSDGVRVLFLIVINFETEDQDVFLVSRFVQFTATIFSCYFC